MSAVVEAGTPYDGVDLVEGAVHLWAGSAERETFALRPDAEYPSPGVGRAVLASAFLRATRAGSIDPAERTTIRRSRDSGDRGVLASLGDGLEPTWRDMLVIALVLEDREAASHLCARLGPAAVDEAGVALGLASGAMTAYPAAPPSVGARAAARVLLGLAATAGPDGLTLLLPLMRGVRYRWRVRTRLAEEWQVATSGSRGASTVEEVALWRTAQGWAAAAVAFTGVHDPWRAEYVMGDGFRRVVEGVGLPVPDGEGGEGR